MLLQHFSKKLGVALWLILGMHAFAQAQFSPADLGGLEIWLDVNTGLTTDNNLVQQWDDQSANARHAISPFPSVQPELIVDGFNGHPVISFDGESDYFSFTEIPNGRTFFWVMKEHPDAVPGSPRPLMGWIGGLNFLRGPNKTFWDNQFSHVGVRSGITRLNLQQIDPFTTEVPSQFFIASLKTSEDVQASHLTQELGIFYRSWWGEMAEIIIYSAPLSDNEILQVEEYLAEKYSPAFTQIPDVNIPYGFCATELCAPQYFTSYNWSTGENSQCINVTEGGEYYLTMTDNFGRVLTDTVVVTYPGNTMIPDSSIVCLGNAFSWNTNLEEIDYSFQWSDNTSNSSIEILDPGEYSLTITDENLCTFTKTFHVAIDSLSAIVTLGPDQNLCAGNSIGLLPHSFNDLQFEWNDDSIDSTFIVSNSGDYNVAVTDSFGCIALDTIHINILGTAPQIGFEATGLCEDASTSLSATFDEIIDTFEWNFGDTFLGSGESVLHEFAVPGDYYIELYVVASSGCSSTVLDTIHVFQKPDVQFSTDQFCQNLPVTFTDLSSSVEGTLINWDWIINGINYSGAEVSTEFAAPGFYNVNLEVTDHHSCVSQQASFLEILPSPLVSFTTSGTCQGALTSFNGIIDNSQTGNVISRAWNFGDNTGSTLTSPTHFYAQSGIYDVSFNVMTANGCGNTYNSPVTIFNKPIADFDVRNACQNVAYTFVNESTSNAQDPIISWHWIVNSQTDLDGPTPTFTFANTGLTPTTLLVTTQNGCTHFVSQQIPVWANPVAAFSYTPEIGEAPFEVQFNNESVGANSALWIFGDTHESIEYEPFFTFTLNGTFLTQLIVTNTAGCADTTARIVNVAFPRYDVMLQHLELQSNLAGQLLTARVVNSGNIVVTQLLMNWQIGNDAPVSEIWNGSLLPGMSMDYAFHSQLHFEGYQFPYLCVEAEPVSNQYTDINPADNTTCNATENNGLVLLPPYPNPSSSDLHVRFISPVNGDIQILVYDRLGKRVLQMSETLTKTGFHLFSLDVSHLPQGYYQLVLKTINSNEMVTFMKRDQ